MSCYSAFGKLHSLSLEAYVPLQFTQLLKNVLEGQMFSPVQENGINFTSCNVTGCIDNWIRRVALAVRYPSQ